MNQSLSSDYSVSNQNHKQPLGQLLNEAGLISAQQIETALQDQFKSPNLKIGEIMALRGWIKQETADFFVEEWYELVVQEQKYPLVYYFRKAALLSEEQINYILEEQTNKEEKVRFHHLAVRMGFLKQQTVDFLVKNLLIPGRNNSSTRKSSFATPYELLKNYIRGETNFQRSEFKKIKLNNVTLKGVNLNHSNLTGAELKQANLSNSSLKLVNLTDANLEKAILKEVDFEGACLNHVNLTDAHLEGSNFQQANLREADLRHGYFVNVCFQGADLRNAKLQGANFKGASYNSETFFDPGFIPSNMGMRLI